MLTGKIGPFIRQKARGGRRPLRNLERRANRRKVLAGYPVDPRPFSEVEIVNYFKGDRITCLLCGKSYRRLAHHLPFIHSVTEDDYRERYGLPYGRGLASDECVAAYALSVTEDRRARMAELGRRYGGTSAREHISPRHTPANIEKATRQLLSFAVGRGTKFTPQDYEAVIGAIEAGAAPHTVLGRNGLPGASAWRAWRRTHPGYDARVLAAIDRLPYPVLAGMQMLGARFRADVVSRRALGQTYDEISRSLGVTKITVRKAALALATPA